MSIRQHNHTKKRLKRRWLCGLSQASPWCSAFPGGWFFALFFLSSQFRCFCFSLDHMSCFQRSQPFLKFVLPAWSKTVCSSWDPGPSRITSPKEPFLQRRGTHTGWPPWGDISVKGQIIKTEDSLSTTILPSCSMWRQPPNDKGRLQYWWQEMSR